MSNAIFLFGYGKHGQEIAEGLQRNGYRVTVVESDETNHQLAGEDGFLDTEMIDVTKDAHLEALQIEENGILVCVMDDEHINVFLTLSLRSLYPDAFILSISDSVETGQKLTMAGANRVIDIYKVSAIRIHNILKKPVATKLFYSFFSDTVKISFDEIVIPEGSPFAGKTADEINDGPYGILLIGMIDREQGENFVFIAERGEHRLDVGDTLVYIGKNDDLERFETMITGKEKK